MGRLSSLLPSSRPKKPLKKLLKKKKPTSITSTLIYQHPTSNSNHSLATAKLATSRLTLVSLSLALTEMTSSTAEVSDTLRLQKALSDGSPQSSSSTKTKPSTLLSGVTCALATDATVSNRKSPRKIVLPSTLPSRRKLSPTPKVSHLSTTSTVAEETTVSTDTTLTSSATTAATATT